MPLSTVSLNPAAPLNTSQPSANPLVNAGLGLAPVAAVNIATSGVAGPEVPMIAGALGVLIEYLKNRCWFREGTWTVPVLIGLSFLIAFLIWYLFFGDIVKAITNGCGILVNAHTNYQGSLISGVGIFKPTAPANRSS